MIRKKLKFQEQINFITDVLTVLISYVLAVVLRYKVMKSDPGLDTLSASYVLIAVAYSIIIASIFQYLRRQDKYTRLKREYGIVVINAIGCLFFLAFFYVIGELYFSRIALILFWLISSFLLEIKWMVLFISFNKKYVQETRKTRILIAGGGEVTNEYIRLVGWDDACDFKIIGYVGKNCDIFYDAIFESNNETEDITKRGWLGGFEQFEEILEKFQPDEVVFALEDAELYRLPKLIQITTEHYIPTCLVASFSKFIPNNPIIYRMADTTIIGLNERKREKSCSIFGLGISVTVVFLLLMLIIDHFDIGNVKGLELYDNYRAFIFSLLGLFIYRYLKVKIKNKNNIIIAIVTILINLIMIYIYEVFYSHGIIILQNIMSDFFMTVGVIVFSCLLRRGANLLGKNDFWMYM